MNNECPNKGLCASKRSKNRTEWQKKIQPLTTTYNYWRYSTILKMGFTHMFRDSLWAAKMCVTWNDVVTLWWYIYLLMYCHWNYSNYPLIRTEDIYLSSKKEHSHLLLYSCALITFLNSAAGSFSAMFTATRDSRNFVWLVATRYVINIAFAHWSEPTSPASELDNNKQRYIKEISLNIIIF